MTVHSTCNQAQPEGAVWGPRTRAQIPDPFQAVLSDNPLPIFFFLVVSSQFFKKFILVLLIYNPPTYFVPQIPHM